MPFLLLIVFYVITPLIINYLCHRFHAIRRLGAILIAYFIGLVIGNIGLFPEAGDYMLGLYAEGAKLTESQMQQLLSQGLVTESDLRFYQLKQLQDMFTTIAIPLALPLLLFSLNVRGWFNIAGKTFLSLLLGLVSVILPIIIGYFLFFDDVEDIWKVAGMLTGVYSGGTPNLASIKTALDVSSETYVLTHTYDMILGAIFLLFVMSVGQKVLLKFLPAYKKSDIEPETVENGFGLQRDDRFFELLKRKTSLPLLAALGIAVLIFAIGGGLSLLVPSEAQMVVAILTITTLGILVSLIPKVNRIKRTFDLGMYFILVFSIVVASMADLRNFSSTHIHIFYWVTLVYVGSLIIHVALSAIFKVDADNVIVVSTALTCSPPFVPVVAGALKNKEIIISGLTVGIIGYAIGNYLGVSIAYLLKSLTF